MNTPFIQNIPENLIEAEEQFSKWIKRIFEDSTIVEEDTKEAVRFNLLRIIKDQLEVNIDLSFPVVLNECLVRGFYFIRRFSIEITKNQVLTFEELDKYEPQDLLPYNNRIVSRMCLIASGVFICVDIAAATARALGKQKVKGREFLKTLLSEISFDGIGRFVFAIAEDSKYWKIDYKVVFEKAFGGNRKSGDGVIENEQKADYDAFEALTLDGLQAQILYSIEALAVQYDIRKTRKITDKKSKEKWFISWKERMMLGLSVTEDYFVSDEDAIYQGLIKLTEDKSSWRWFYLLALEIALFRPYHGLGTEDDKDYKKLKYEYDYLSEQFVRRQTVITQRAIDNVIKYNR